MAKTTANIMLVAFALVIGFMAGKYLSTTTTTVTPIPPEEPLYWVAPMDPNFRRDKPGVSPMGMDLIPVFADAQTKEEGPGTIRVSPDVVHNLGVKTSPVVQSNLESEIVTVGYVQYDEDRLIHIHPRMSGWVEKLYVKATGELVTKGEPLYSLYSPELMSAQEDLLLSINRNNKRLIAASKNRLRALKIPESFIHSLYRDREIKQTVTFFAPQSGYVENLNIREGFFVQPGTTMLSIGSLDQVWVVAEIFERQSAWVKKNDPVTMVLDYIPGRTWKGNIDYIYPTLDKDNRTVRVRLRFDNQDELLKPNMFAQVTVHTKSTEETVVIPRNALIRTGSQNRVVLALGDGRFKSIEVGIGRTDQHQIEILQGLYVGDQIVTSAQFLLDSESSKSSDFTRMHHEDEQDDIEEAEAIGVINSIDGESGFANISRGPIDKWNRPAATVEFALRNGLNVDELMQGMRVRFTFQVHPEALVITQIQQLSEEGTKND